jgi:hypothetical protein
LQVLNEFGQALDLDLTVGVFLLQLIEIFVHQGTVCGIT